MIKVGLNIGNSKISCAVSEIEKNKKIKLLSFQSFQTNVLKKNIITNFEELSNDIKSLISESEKKSQTKINSVNLNIHMIDSVSRYYDSQIENLEQQITDLDIKKIINKSEYFNVDDDYYQIFNKINGYVIDGNLIHNTPVGKKNDVILEIWSDTLNEWVEVILVFGYDDDFKVCEETKSLFKKRYNTRKYS